MNVPRPTGRKPSPRADTAPERRRNRRDGDVARIGKAFCRGRSIFTASDFLEPDFVPGYN
jgi:hypothetical protein